MSPPARKRKPGTTDFEEKVYDACARIPRGSVSTYSDIARSLGRPGYARAVGNALGKNPYSEVPCYRVVRSDGGVGGYSAPGGSKLKARKLKGDGLEVRGLRVVGLERYTVEVPDLRPSCVKGRSRTAIRKRRR